MAFVLLAWGAGFAAGAVFVQLAARSSLRRTPSATIIALGAAAATGALFAPCEPTTVPVVNAILRCGLAVLFVVGASRARRSTLVVAAVIVAVPAVIEVSTAPYLIVALAVATAGAAAASYLFPQRVPMFSAIVGLLLSQAVLRIPTSLPARVPSALAMVALAVLFVSSGAHLSAVARRRLTLGLVAFGTIGFFCAVGGAIALVNSRGQVERGISASKRGLVMVSSGDTAGAMAEFGTARSALGSARRNLESPLARIGRLVPVISQHITTVHDLTGVADDVIAAAETTAGQADLRSFRAEAGRIDTERMVGLRGQIDVAETALTKARVALTTTDGTWLAGPVSHRIASLNLEVDNASHSVTKAHDILAVVPAMFGADGPRRYLLVTPTPAEARGSGGVIGNYGEISAVNGKFALDVFGRDGDLNANGTPSLQRVLKGPADFVARYNKFGAAQIWQLINLSPDFPSSAQAMAGMYPQSGGRPVDGVISADPIALAAFLKIIGPITVPSWPVPITPENAPRVLMLDAYIVKGGATKGRLQLLSDVAQTVWAKLATASLPDPKTIIDALAPAVRERHLQIWMKDDAEQRYLAKVGVAGNVPPIQGDGLGVVTNNASGGKIEYFLHRTVSYDAVVDPVKQRVASTATITLRNDAPATGLPDYVIDNLFEGLSNGTNRTYLSLYSPLALTSATADGKPLVLEPETELGRNVYSAWVIIPSKSSMTIVATFAGPLGGVDKDYRLEVFRQPLVNPDTFEVRVRSADGRPLRGTTGFDSPSGPDRRTVSSSGTVASVNTFLVDLNTR